jgi:hypothetical protein
MNVKGVIDSMIQVEREKLKDNRLENLEIKIMVHVSILEGRRICAFRILVNFRDLFLIRLSTRVWDLLPGLLEPNSSTCQLHCPPSHRPFFLATTGIVQYPKKSSNGRTHVQLPWVRPSSPLLVVVPSSPSSQSYLRS